MPNSFKEKSLIAYYSRKGQNYLDGRVVALPVGNTEVIAKKIQGITGSDLFRIDTVKPYPVDYDETTEVAKLELRKKVRPELSQIVKNMEDYGLIYLGYPNWWGTFPAAVFTFLESYDFSGKTIVPFCTHEGSGLGSSERDIHKLCAGAILEKGIAIQGGNVNGADSLIGDWLSKLLVIEKS
jgi:flavodoxin